MSKNKHGLGFVRLFDLRDLPPPYAEETKALDYDARRQTLTIRVAGPYEVDLDRIPNRAALLEWVRHIGEKTWVSKELLLAFIDRVLSIAEDRLGKRYTYEGIPTLDPWRPMMDEEQPSILAAVAEQDARRKERGE